MVDSVILGEPRDGGDGTPGNPNGLPDGVRFGIILHRIFRAQKQRVLKRLGVQKDVGHRVTKAPLPLPESDWWVEPIDFSDAAAEAAQLAPACEFYATRGMNEMAARVGNSQIAVNNPYAADAIRNQSIRLAESTAATTAKDMNTALEHLRAALTAEMMGGANTLRSLTQAVNGVFENAATYRAQRIAATEASRAVHDGRVAAAAKSGVVSGWDLLVSSDACSTCQAIYAVNPNVTMADALQGIGSITDRGLPPFHPNCFCSAAEVVFLLPDSGGRE